VLYSYAVNRDGDADLVLWANDWQGNKCDKYGAWPDVRNNEVKICVSDCDQTMNATLMVTPLSASATVPGYKSVGVLGYCIPDTFYIGLDSSISISNTIYEIWSGKWMVVMAMCLAIVFCVLYLSALNVLAEAMAYILMGCFIIGGLVSTVILIYISYDDNTYNLEVSWLLFSGGILMGVVTLLFIAFCCWFQKNLGIAVEIMDQAGDALVQLCGLVFASIIDIAFIILFTGLWLYISLYLFSLDNELVTKHMPDIRYGNCAECGSLKTRLGSSYQKYKWNPSFDWYALYMVFILYYGINFLRYFWYLLVSCAVAEWYFSLWAGDGDDYKERGDEPDQLSRWPVCQAFGRVSMYHMGTVSVAAIVLAFLNTIQAFFMWIHRRVFQSGSPIARCITCCVGVCLKCMECCLSFVSRGAMNYCAIFGTPFCPSASRAFSIISRNLSNIAALTIVNEYVTFLGRWGITIGSSGISFFILGVQMKADEVDFSTYALTFLWVVMIFLCYVISSIVLGIFDVAVDQIFMSFMVDYQVNKGAQMFASDDLISLVKETKAKSSRVAIKLERQQTNISMEGPTDL